MLGGQQIRPVGGASGSPLDTSGAYAREQAGRNLAYQNQLGAYNADVASQNSFQSGLFGLGAAAIPLLSDRRSKTEIQPLGIINGLMRYSFKYIGDTIKRIGVMADEVLFKHPEAISVNPSGYLMVDYRRIS